MVMIILLSVVFTVLMLISMINIYIILASLGEWIRKRETLLSPEQDMTKLNKEKSLCK